MPSRNRIKVFGNGMLYHVYNRGVEKRKIFIDEDDYAVYLHLVKRYLGIDVEKDSKGREYPNYYGAIEVVAFCLMPNHYHFLLYVNDQEVVSKIWQSVNSSYVMYFNKKYQRVGPLFQDRFKASLVFEEAYYMHISRYIHLNPANWREWEFSSLPYFFGTRRTSWVNPERVLVGSPGQYMQFMEDYAEHKKLLEDIKSRLA